MRRSRPTSTGSSRKIPEARAFAFAPPSIPGIGTAGGFTFVLEDRAGRDVSFLSGNLDKFMAAARARKELAGVSTTFLPSVPQVYVKVDRDKVLKQGVELGDVYRTLQCYMGGIFVNYFNRFGRQWQVYVEAEGRIPQQHGQAGQLFRAQPRRRDGASFVARLRGKPNGARVHDEVQPLPERTDQRIGVAGLQLGPGSRRAGGRVCQDDAKGDGLRLHRDVLPGEEGGGGHPARRHFRASRFSLCS